jgi:hypothetical protein
MTVEPSHGLARPTSARDTKLSPLRLLVTVLTRAAMADFCHDVCRRA